MKVNMSMYLMLLAMLTALQCVSGDDPFCWAMGDPHYRTFDNKRFDFMGPNSYYLVKDWEFTVVVEHRACGNRARRITCTKSVTVRTKNFQIRLLQRRAVTINGRSVRLPWRGQGILIKIAPDARHVTVFLPNDVRIKWDGYMWVTVYIPESMRGNRLKGLCGSYNGNVNDDFKLPDGSVSKNVNTFGNAWQKV